jgi:hypothetical protein
MTAAADNALAVRALAAYEHGRLRWALARATVAAGAASAAMLGCPARGAALASCVACALTAAALLAVCLWRGGAWAHGAQLGFAAGLVPCWLPTLLMRSVHVCGGTACLTMPAVCCLGGLGAGLLLCWRAPRRERRQGLRFWLAVAATALLAGSTGCAAAGLAGFAGMTLGMLLGAAPTAALQWSGRVAD